MPADPLTTPPSPPRPPPPAPGSGKPGWSAAAQKKVRNRRLFRLATVLTVLGALAFVAVVWVVVQQFFAKPTAAESKVDAARLLLGRYAGGVAQFLEARGRLPRTLPELRDVDPGYDAQPWDAWAHPIEYRVVDEKAHTFRLRSLGPDGKPDTADDVVYPPGATWR